MVSYNDKLDADEQITAEEDIAHLLFINSNFSEEKCQVVSKQILLTVLIRFRSDLIER